VHGVTGEKDDAASRANIDVTYSSRLKGRRELRFYMQDSVDFDQISAASASDHQISASGQRPTP